MLQALKNLCKSTVYAKSVPVLRAVPNAESQVLILGWGGSNPKHYNKILQHYEDKGVSTVLHIMPLPCPKFIRTEFEEDIASLANQQVSANAQLRTHVHVYSQNGTWVLSNLLQRALLPQIDSVVFDSTPAFKYVRRPVQDAHEIAVLATSLFTGKAQYYHFPFTPFIKSVLLIKEYLGVFTDRIFPQKYYFFMNMMEVNRYIRDNFPSIPILFIYSTGDVLIPPANVKEFINALKERNVPTSEHVFGDEVSHVSASYKYPTEYYALVDNFFKLK